MKSFQEAKSIFLNNHNSKMLKQPERRINALKAIENCIQFNAPELLQGDMIFKIFDKDTFILKYQTWKGSPISGAEKSVVIDIFKFAN